MPPSANRLTVPFFLAWSLFVVSFFFPACEDYVGWRCAWISLGFFLELFSGNFDRGWGLYHGAFTVHNAFMLLSPIAVFRRDITRRWFNTVMMMAAIAVLHISSFSILTGGDGFRVGYFLWLAAFAVFCGGWARLGLRLGFLPAKAKIAVAS